MFAVVFDKKAMWIPDNKFRDKQGF